MNTFKKNGGFTLVELIIVIAILAILSSVAVAGYSTYIKSANNSAVESFLNDMKTHIVLANAEAGNVGNITVVATKTNNKTTALVVYVKAGDPGFAAKFGDNLKEVYTSITVTDYTAADGAYKTFTLTDVPTAWDNSDYAKGTVFTTAWSEKATVEAPALPMNDNEETE